MRFRQQDPLPAGSFLRRDGKVTLLPGDAIEPLIQSAAVWAKRWNRHGLRLRRSRHPRLAFRPFRCLSLDPISLPLEGIGRQRHFAARVRLIEPRPLYLRPLHVELPQGIQYLFPFPLPPPQRIHPGLPGPADAFLPESRQRRSRPHLQELLTTRFPQTLHGFREPNRLQDLPPPVSRIAHLTASHGPPTHTRDQTQARRRKCDLRSEEH